MYETELMAKIISEQEIYNSRLRKSIKLDILRKTKEFIEESKLAEDYFSDSYGKSGDQIEGEYEKFILRQMGKLQLLLDKKSAELKEKSEEAEDYFSERYRKELKILSKL